MFTWLTHFDMASFKEGLEIYCVACYLIFFSLCVLTKLTGGDLEWWDTYSFILSPLLPLVLIGALLADAYYGRKFKREYNRALHSDYSDSTIEPFRPSDRRPGCVDSVENRDTKPKA